MGLHEICLGVPYYLKELLSSKMSYLQTYIHLLKVLFS